MVNVAAIVVFILVQSARALKSGVVRPVDLEDTRTYKFAENDVTGVLMIEISAYDQTYQLGLKDAEKFFSDDLSVPNVRYVDGEAFVGTKKVGLAFGEFRTVTQHFVGQFRSDVETFFVEEENSKVYIYKASDQPQNASKSHKGDDKTQPVEADEGPKMLFQSRGDPTGHICPMKFTVDSVLYEAMGSDKSKVQSSVLRLVQALNVIYDENSIIVHKNDYKSVKFSLQELVIADSYSCKSKSSHLMCARRVYDDSDTYLKKHSYDNHENFCLSYLLTGHAFAEALGVAYVGGVCSSHGRFRDSRTNQVELRSTNAGFVAIAIEKNLEEVRAGYKRNCFVEGRVPTNNPRFGLETTSTTPPPRQKFSSWFDDWGLNKFKDIFRRKSSDSSAGYIGHTPSAGATTDADNSRDNSNAVDPSSNIGTILTSVFVSVFILSALIFVTAAYIRRAMCFQSTKDGPRLFRSVLRDSVVFKKLKAGSGLRLSSMKRPSMRIEANKVKNLTNLFQKLEVENQDEATAKPANLSRPPPTYPSTALSNTPGSQSNPSRSPINPSRSPINPSRSPINPAGGLTNPPSAQYTEPVAFVNPASRIQAPSRSPVQPVSLVHVHTPHSASASSPKLPPPPRPSTASIPRLNRGNLKQFEAAPNPTLKTQPRLFQEDEVPRPDLRPVANRGMNGPNISVVNQMKKNWEQNAFKS